MSREEKLLQNLAIHGKSMQTPGLCITKLVQYMPDGNGCGYISDEGGWMAVRTDGIFLNIVTRLFKRRDEILRVLVRSSFLSWT